MAHFNSHLERMLRVVPKEPEQLSRFYRQLLGSEILVPVLVPKNRVARGKVPAGEFLNVITLVRIDGVEVLPFFTSPARVYRWQATGAYCVIMYVHELFESRPDMHFCLNPTSSDGLEFTPTEAQALLLQR